MGSLLTYSGLTTKVKAMERHLLSQQDFLHLASMESVAQAVEYLKRLPAYEDVFSGIEDASLHREGIEQLLAFSLYRDFAKLYRFSSLTQRKFLDLYFMHYEISILKQCLRHAMGHEKTPLHLSITKDFFHRHSRLDLERLSSAETLPDFLTGLEGSPYYKLLSHFANMENPSLFDFEMQLDLLYFKNIWKVKDKYIPKSEQDILTQCFGSKLDLLNIQWVYRSKKYYQMDAASIYPFLIPNHYKLKKAQLQKLVQASAMDEFFSILKTTYYGSLPFSDVNEQPDLEALYKKVLYRIHSVTVKKDPYSIASLNSYLYFKEEEINQIITAIECIRYGLPPAQIMNYLMKHKEGGVSQ